jgi:hypothetical protein
MRGKDEELNLDQLRDTQGGIGFELSAKKTSASRLGEIPAGESHDPSTDPLDGSGQQADRRLGDDALIAIYGGASFELGAKKAAAHGELEEIDPKWVIQDPWGDPAGEGGR